MNIEFIDVVQALIDGVLYGSTYALIGLGFTLIFGAMEKLNMAYAASSIGGAYVGLGVSVLFSLPLFAIFLIGPIGGGLLSFLVYICCFRYLPSNNHLAALMASIGGLFFIDEIISHETDGSPLEFPELGIFSEAYFEIEFSDMFLGFRGDLIFVMFASFLAMLMLMYLLYKTRLGLATRAVSQQPIAAQLCGISVEKTNSLVFVIAGFIGGLAGAMTSASIGLLSPMLILPFTVKGLIVTVIGGLGSIPGAIIAGLMLGGFENVFMALRGVTERDMYVMLLLFVFLIFRPQGLFSNSVNRD